MEKVSTNRFICPTRPASVRKTSTRSTGGSNGAASNLNGGCDAVLCSRSHRTGGVGGGGACLDHYGSALRRGSGTAESEWWRGSSLGHRRRCLSSCSSVEGGRRRRA